LELRTALGVGTILADGLKQIEATAREKTPGTWIVAGGGWAPTQFSEKRLPTRAELDAVAPKHPVYVQYLRQAAVLNSAGLVAAGIDGKAPIPGAESSSVIRPAES
jgi:predicted amidohydrolase YtcJ